MKNRPSLIVSITLVLVVGITAFALLSSKPAQPLTSDNLHSGPVIIGRTAALDSNLIAEIYSAALRSKGLSTALTISSSDEVFISALEQGKIDVFPEYLGLIAQQLNSRTDGIVTRSYNSVNVDQVLTHAQQLARPLGIDVLDPTPSANDFVYTVSTSFAQANNLRSLSDLARWSHTNSLRFGGPTRCIEQLACATKLQSTYGMTIKDIDVFNTAGVTSVNAIVNGEVDAAAIAKFDSNTNDSRITVLDEDIPLYHLTNYVPLVTGSAMTATLVSTLNEVSAKVTNAKFSGMLAEIEVSGRTPAQVAAEFVSTSGLSSFTVSGITPIVGVEMKTDFPTAVPTMTSSAPPIMVSSTNQTEMQIVAELYATYLRMNGIPARVRNPLISSELNHSLANGKTQLAPVLLSEHADYLNRQAYGPLALPISGPEPLEVAGKANRLSKYLGYTLLMPSPAQEANAFTVTRAFAQSYNINTLSQLALWSKENPITVAQPPNCENRVFCSSFLEDFYKVNIAKILSTDSAGPLTRVSLDRNKVQVGWLFSLDPGIPEFNFTILTDDQGFQPAFNVTPAIRANVLTPTVIQTLNAVSAAFTTEDLAEMTQQVEFGRSTIKQAVFDFLFYEGPGVDEKTEHLTGGSTAEQTLKTAAN